MAWLFVSGLSNAWFPDYGFIRPIPAYDDAIEDRGIIKFIVIFYEAESGVLSCWRGLWGRNLVHPGELRVIDIYQGFMKVFQDMVQGFNAQVYCMSTECKSTVCLLNASLTICLNKPFVVDRLDRSIDICCR
ncbi:hypothetical protein CEXT_22941 [Caerostris extrusa]|uniref:Uncharacterized protein n=1 Tax=Caerostris extrusa TaxID=172846 RepID=A0AAV4VBW2_CAEEX|nr:hypothetical protein CEXT_22941 [Caerostris extrusa]